MPGLPALSAAEGDPRCHRGRHGLWTRLPELQPASLFVWGKRDTIVPIAFAEHVRAAVPAAQHLELDCGHVPQLERPRQIHRALSDFLAQAALSRSRSRGRHSASWDSPIR